MFQIMRRVPGMKKLNADRIIKVTKDLFEPMGRLGISAIISTQVLSKTVAQICKDEAIHLLHVTPSCGGPLMTTLGAQVCNEDEFRLSSVGRVKRIVYTEKDGTLTFHRKWLKSLASVSFILVH